MLFASIAACVLGLPLMPPQGVVAAANSQTSATVQRPLPGYPADVEIATCHPFRDDKGPVDTTLAAAGSGDLDGDGNPDLWFLAAAGTNKGRISLQMARVTSLGRYRDWHVSTAGNFPDAASYRSSALSRDGIIAVDPSSDQPILLTWNRKSPTSDPRDGFLGGGGVGWQLGKGCYEIEARDDVGDGHDDITVLQQLPNGHTRVKKLCMNTSLHKFLWPETSVKTDVPATLGCLRMLDVDGDNRSDFVALVKGLGVLVGRDNTREAFEPVAFWPIASGIRDLCVGDVQGDGRDDIALCFDRGILVMLSTSKGFVPRAMFNPPLVGPLASACLLDVDGTGMNHLLGFFEDGRSYVFHDNTSIVQGRSKPVMQPAQSDWSRKTFVGLRPGAEDLNLIVTDVDNDRDLDLLLRTPDRTGFMTLRNPVVALRPTALTVSDVGPLPVTEPANGTVQNLFVRMPPLLRERGFTLLEAAFFVVDPDSKSSKDPDYLYWGSLIAPLDPPLYTVTLRAYAWSDRKSWDAQVREYKKQRDKKLPTAALVYPKESGAIRFSPDGFVSVHGYNGSQRAESSHVTPDPNTSKSTLGPRWVLKVDPPKPKADRELLPWD